MQTFKFGPRLSLLALALLLSSSFAEARRFQLFENGQPHPSYDQIIADLHNGDRIYFSNHRMFRIQDHFDSYSHYAGGAVTIVGVGQGKVLLLPKFCSQPEVCQWHKNQLIRYVLGHDRLAAMRIATPRLFLDESFLPEYLKQESVTVLDNLESAEAMYSNGNYPFEALFEKHLRKFIWDTALFQKIGGFSLKNVGLTMRGFVLMGWDDSHEIYSGQDDEDRSLLSELPTRLIKRHEELAQLVHQRRESFKCNITLSSSP